VSGADPLPRFAKEVTLRRLAPSDLPEFQAYRSDPVLARYQDWKVKSDAEASAFLIKMSSAKLLQPGKWSQIGIAEPDGLRLIGDIGLLLAGDGGHAEIGFTLRRQSQGRGIGTAAVREAIDLLFEQTNVDRVLGIADARNIASIRLLRRVGMHIVDTRDALSHDEPCVEHVYVISRHHGAAKGGIHVSTTAG
jgi:RimJ/RimL family protein N-acetyltransferase